jgi:hypothetical protein
MMLNRSPMNQTARSTIPRRAGRNGLGWIESRLPALAPRQVDEIGMTTTRARTFRADRTIVGHAAVNGENPCQETDHDADTGMPPELTQRRAFPFARSACMDSRSFRKSLTNRISRGADMRPSVFPALWQALQRAICRPVFPVERLFTRSSRPSANEM